MRRPVHAAAAVLAAAVLVLAGCSGTDVREAAPAGDAAPGRVDLPAPALSGGMALNEAIAKRACVRRFQETGLGREEVSQLLWACQGRGAGDGGAVTSATRNAPSAGATHPLTAFFLEGDTLYRYQPGSHSLVPHAKGIDRNALTDAALGQPFVGGAPALFVLAVELDIIEPRYAERAERYAWMEAGHAAQNLLLQSEALGIGAVPVGAFDEGAVAAVLGLSEGVRPLYLVPAGRPAGG